MDFIGTALKYIFFFLWFQNILQLLELRGLALFFLFVSILHYKENIIFMDMVWTYRKFKFQKFGRYGDQNFNWEHTKHDWICWENCTIFYFWSLICITRRILIIISWKIPARLFTGLCVDHTMYSCEAKRCEPAHIWLYLHYDAETVSRTIESFGYFKEQDHPAMFTLILKNPQLN